MDRNDAASNQKMTKILAELKAVEEIMSFAITREASSADYYRRAYGKATTEAARKAFSILLEQEKDHERIMREQLGEVRKEIARVRDKMKG